MSFVAREYWLAIHREGVSSMDAQRLADSRATVGTAVDRVDTPNDVKIPGAAMCAGVSSLIR